MTPVPQNEFQLVWMHTTPLEFWSLIAVVVIVVAVKKAAETYEAFAKFIPIVGAWIQKRHMAREDAEAAAQKAAISEAVTVQLATVAPELRKEVDELKQRVAVLEQDKAVTNDWRVYETEWHFQYEEHCAALGWEAKPHLKFHEFAAKWHEGFRYDNGAWHRP